MVELKEIWATSAFEFAMWKSRDIPVLKAFGVVIEDLEEAQLLLQVSVLYMLYVKDGSFSLGSWGMIDMTLSVRFITKP